jgi:hypothetical protein
MDDMRLVSGLLVLVGMAAPLAHAQVFKCTEADGKTVYSQAPCTKADNKEKVVKLMDAPLTDSTPSEAREARNGSYNQADSIAPDKPAKNYQTPPSNRLRQLPQTPANTGPTNEQLIAECEANKGARCSSAAEIAYRRQEKRTPSAQEQATIQAAIRARREREENELRNRHFRR